MKQSIKASLTLLHPVTSFSEFIRKDFTGIRMIAHCSSGYTRENIKNIYSKGHDAVLLIGPEGDFTDDEIREATSMGFISIHLGPSRLRAETAGIAACHSIYFLNL
jgi:16S rRNA (uracil1498-N3)-methyltransferase